jgi:hypothetical protein
MANGNGHFRRLSPLVAHIDVNANPELKNLVGRAADEAGIPLSEMVVRILAEHFKRPDLAIVPRKIGGRPRKELATP